MTRILAGTLLDRPPGAKYVEALSFAELTVAMPLPRPLKLARWRRAVGSGFVFSLVAPASCVESPKGGLLADAALEAGQKWIAESAKQVDAAFVVVPTGSQVTPGQRDRDRLTAYFTRLRGLTEARLVWAPTGLWEAETALQFAASMGVDLAQDPLRDELVQGKQVYIRLRALGARRRFSDGMLEDLLIKLEEAEADEVFIAIESPQSFKQATSLIALAKGMPAADDDDDDIDEDADEDDEDLDEDDDSDSDNE